MIFRDQLTNLRDYQKSLLCWDMAYVLCLQIKPKIGDICCHRTCEVRLNLYCVLPKPQL